MSGRRQTTKGVWVARAPKCPTPPTLVLDLEGSDGRERGEDDTNFERQSALFALAVADALLVNVWCHDIGREHGSGKPLLKTIFGVNLKLFSPEPGRRRPTLLFVIRDRSKTPMARLTEVLREDLDRLWLSLPKPAQARDKAVDDYFDVQYAGLPHYEERHEEFCAEVAALRRRFSLSADSGGGGGDLVRGGGGGGGDGNNAEARLPADAFAMSAAGIWAVIRAQKDLNLPAHKVMVAGVRCGEIARDQLSSFRSDQAWLALEAEAIAAEGSDGGLARPLPDFGPRLRALARSCLAGYDAEAAYFDAGPRAGRRADLAAGLAAAARPAFDAQVSLAARARAAEFERALRVASAEGAPFSQAAREAREVALAAFDRDARRACVGTAAGGGNGGGDSDGDGAADGEDGDGVGGDAEILLLASELSPAPARDALAAALDARVDVLRRQRLEGALQSAQRLASDGVAAPAVELLAAVPPLLWPRLHSARDEALACARNALSESLAGVELSEGESAQADARLASAAEGKLRDLLKEAALTRAARMRERFGAAFSVDPDTRAPRTWRPRDDVPALAREARMAAARVLAALAVRRGPDYVGGDAVERAVLSMAAADCCAADAAAERAAAAAQAAAAAAQAAAAAAAGNAAAAAADMVGGSVEMAAMAGRDVPPPSTPAPSLQGAPGTALKAAGPGGAGGAPGAATPTPLGRPRPPASAGGAAAAYAAAAGTPLAGGYDLAAASAWPAGAVAHPDDVLITPAEARTAWRELMAASALSVQQAAGAQQAAAAADRRGAPVWALLAIAMLGWNELVAVLWNPLYLIVGAVLALFGWQLYRELDVDAEMQRGLLPGLISVAGRLVPTARSVAERSLASVARLVAEGGQALAEQQRGGQQQQRQEGRQRGEEEGEDAGGGEGGSPAGGGGGGGRPLRRPEGVVERRRAPGGADQRPPQQQQQQWGRGEGDEMDVDAYDGKAD